MKGILVSEFGEPNKLEYVDMPDPKPKHHEVIVEAKAIGINFADVMMRKGTYPGGPSVPFTPGFEVAGHVVELGKTIKNLKIGDRVLGFAWKGAYAEKVPVAERNCLPLKESLTDEEAVAVPVNYQTAYHMLKSLGNIKEGNVVLIHAAAGGVGTAAVQLAKIYGAQVIATVGSDDKKDLVEKLGADIVVNYNKIDFEDAVMEFTHHVGVDIALESIGGECFTKTIRTLKFFGKMMVFGFSTGTEGIAKTTDFIYHSRAIMGFHLASVVRNTKLHQEGIAEIQRLLDEDKIHPVVGNVFPLKDAGKAHAAIESRGTVGKVVLKP